MIPFDVQLNGDGCWPELKTKGFTEARFVGIALLTKGTVSGRPSVTARFEMPDGTVVLGETTARLFCMAAKAIMARHPDLFEGD